ncbi:3-oxoacyl-ACP reductase FabG [Cytobacillus firmus]|uniref:3-oxoacyl-ACP reductase FabG n=1 Tax=Cytobacillus firmus TaxID=1399 RepID=UPI0030023EB1
MNATYNFENKIALVTGGSRGIGRGIVKQLSQAGCRVFFTYKNSKTSADELVDECKNYKGDVTAYYCDHSKFDSIDELYDLLQKEGPIDYLINNAGITKDKPLYKLNTEDILSVLQINLVSSIYICKKFIRHLLVTKGSIINISSVAGITGIAGQTNYASSKGGLNAFTKSLSKELGRSGVRVNTIAPGYINTDMTSKFSKEHIKQTCKSISLNRFGEAEEVAKTALFLLSSESAYITGQTIIVDGGLI